MAEDLGIGSDPGLELYREKQYWQEGIRAQSGIILSCMSDVSSVGGQGNYQIQTVIKMVGFMVPSQELRLIDQ